MINKFVPIQTKNTSFSKDTLRKVKTVTERREDAVHLANRELTLRIYKEHQGINKLKQITQQQQND